MKVLLRAYGPLAVFPGLAALLTGLRLAGVIQLSWWWILAPIWIPVLVFVMVIALDLDVLDHWPHP